MGNSPRRSITKRIFLVGILLSLVGAGLLIVRLFRLQIIDGDKYERLAIEQQMKSNAISPERGTIYDRNKNTLAQSATAWTVIVDPSRILDMNIVDKQGKPVKITKEEQKNLIADKLSKILDVDKETIYKKCSKKSNWQWIKKRIEKEDADKVLKFISENNLNSIHLEQDTKRCYPYGSLASSVLGFVNFDGNGAMGLEAYYNKVLSGTPGQITSIQNGKSKEMPYRYQELYEAKDGNSVVLTIDEKIQHFVENELETATIEFGVKGGAIGIVMDVNTGEILAMSSKPDYDPNLPQVITDPFVLEEIKNLEGEKLEEKKQEAIARQWRNSAVSDPYEPGSVFKLITSAGALDCGAVNLNSSFFCAGSVNVAGHTIHCWKLSGHGAQSFVQAVQNSCNPAFIKIGQSMGSDNFYKYFEGFGLTEMTGIDLPGEAESIYHHKKNLGIAQLSSSAFGQTFKITPIQLITAVSAAVNGGELMQPFIVKEVLDSNGNIIDKTEPVVKRQVIPEKVSETVRYLGFKVVDGGSGRRAGVPGYKIGGKTGTSQKLDMYDENGNKLNKHILSFLGFAPADDPQIAVLVALDDPSLANVYGSSTAAPVVGAIIKSTLDYLGMEPTYTSEQLAKKEANVPYLLGQVPHNAQSTLTLMGLDSKIVGKGLKVIKQVPAVGQKIPLNGTVILYTEENAQIEKISVPSVVGLSAQEANRTILNAGLNIKIDTQNIEGDDKTVSSQFPIGGTQVDIGTVIEVKFTQKLSKNME